MTVFISYARANQVVAEQLRADVERCHRSAWVDRELTGGQSWWRTILHHIREADVFVVALSPQWVHSRACDLELRYALALRRPLLPVMVARTDPRLAPPVVADAQIIDYLSRSPETTFALRDALDALPAAPPLPAPLPPEPAAPISYLHNIVVMLNAPTLDPRSQYNMWHQLRAALDEAEDDEQAELAGLGLRLRKRRDLVPALRCEIDDVLGPPTSPDLHTPPAGAPVWTAQTQLHSLPLPTPLPAPPPPAEPPARSHRWLTWAAVPAVMVLLALSVWFASTVAGNEGAGPSRQTQTPSSTTSPSPITATPPGGDGNSGNTGNTGRRGGKTNPPPTITMPGLAGQAPDSAEQVLRGAGWQGGLGVQSEQVDDPSRHGIVLHQNPGPGATLGVSDPVLVTIGEYTEPTPEPEPEPIPEDS